MYHINRFNSSPFFQMFPIFTNISFNSFSQNECNNHSHILPFFQFSRNVYIFLQLHFIINTGMTASSIRQIFLFTEFPFALLVRIDDFLGFQNSGEF